MMSSCGLAAIARSYPIHILLKTNDFWKDWAPLAIWYGSLLLCLLYEIYRLT